MSGLPNDLLLGDDGAVYAGTGASPTARVYVMGLGDGVLRRVITNLPGAWEIILRAGLLYTTARRSRPFPLTR